MLAALAVGSRPKEEGRGERRDKGKSSFNCPNGWGGGGGKKKTGSY